MPSAARSKWNALGVMNWLATRLLIKRFAFLKCCVTCALAYVVRLAR